jgi:outer membrane protein assembly factor BamB
MGLAARFALLSTLLASPALGWQARVDGVQNVEDPPRSIAIAPSGDVVVCGGGFVTKYAGETGRRVWETPIGERDEDQLRLDRFPRTRAGALAVDGHGDVYAAGYEQAGGLPVGIVAKISGATGRVLWTRRIQLGGDDAHSLGSIAIAPDGDVIAAGTRRGDRGADMLAVKVGGDDGAVRWVATLDSGGEDQGLALALDSRGDAAIAGDSQTFSGFEFAVVKVDGEDGSEIWRARLPGPDHNGQAYAVAFDPAGDAIASGGVSSQATGFDVAVVKLDGESGAELWHHFVDGTYAGPELDYEFGEALAVDRAGVVTVVGELRQAETRYDVAVLAWDGDGNELLRATLDGGLALDDRGRAVAPLGGDVLVAGTVDSSSYIDGRFAALLVDPSSGTERWRVVLEGNDDGDVDAGSAVAADGRGGVFAAGMVVNRGSRDDGVVVKLAAASGAELWRAIENETVSDLDEAAAVALDPRGDAVAVGTLGTVEGGRDLAVVKLAGATGAELWRAAIDGPLGADDDGWAVAVDSSGHALAAGRTIRAPGQMVRPGLYLPPFTDFVVAKLDAASGEERWRAEITGDSNGFTAAEAVAVDGADDVVAAGFLGVGALVQTAFAVVKLDGATGAELWRSPVAGSSNVFPEGPVAIAVDRADAVVASWGNDVVKLDPTSGELHWRHHPGFFVKALVLAPNGDVLVAGGDSEANDAIVLRLAGADGAPLWSFVGGLAEPHALAVDERSGDVVAAGIRLPPTYVPRLAAMRLDGASGNLLWLHEAETGSGRALATSVDARGSAVVAGAVGAEGGSRFVVLALDAADGRESWRREFAGASGFDDEARAIALGGGGDVVAAGIASREDTATDLTVVKLDGRTGDELGGRRQVACMPSLVRRPIARGAAAAFAGARPSSRCRVSAR